jgi:hypothetical protein
MILNRVGGTVHWALKANPLGSRTRASAVGSMEFRRLLDCRLVQHQHLDDRLRDDQPFLREWHILVAIVALRMDWLHDCCLFHLHDGTDWRDLSHQLSSRGESFLWYLGFPMASL